MPAPAGRRDTVRAVSAPLKRTVFATAGHVDHGKTSLIRALTGTDTDRLPDEKRRGISIELGFAQLGPISFIDVPGHHKLVHAMIAGVGGVDAALLVVAADDGVMPQTREHLWVCSLLGVERVVVALTKCDLVDEETQELAEADIESTLEGMGIRAEALVRTSAQTGQGLELLKEALHELAEGVTPRADSARVWLPIDRVFTIKGAGTVVTGTLTRGRLRVGETLYVAGEDDSVETSCRGLEIHGESVQEAPAPTRVAVNLARVGRSDLARGGVISRDPKLWRTRRMDVALRALPGTEKALKHRSPVVVHVGTARSNGRIVHLGEGLAHLSLEHPLPCQGGVGFVLRGFSSTREYGRVVGGGRVLDAGAPKLARRRERELWDRRARALEAVRKGEITAALAELIELGAPRPIDAADVERRLGLEPGEVMRLLGGKKKKGTPAAISLADGAEWTSAKAIERLTAELVAWLERYHAEHPHELGASLATVRAALARRAGPAAAQLALDRALRAGTVRSEEQGLACLAEFAERSGPRAQQAADSVLEVLSSEGLTGVSDAALEKKTGESPELLRGALTRLQGSGQARRLGGMWFAEAQLEALRDKVRDHFRENATLSVPTFKDLAGVSRKQAIPLLEQLDREGTTRRQGDDRVAGAKTRA